MAGNISLSLTHQFDKYSGQLLAGGRLYFYTAGTVNPQSAFRDPTLTSPYPNPLTLDVDARVPVLWFADGVIRCRITDRNGVLQIDADNIQVFGSSSTSTGGGTVYVDTTDVNAIAKTGDIKWRASIGESNPGWLRCNGRTIGSALSSGQEMASADAHALYNYLWNSFPNAVCAVGGGRGASAEADWTVNKTITLLDLRGRGPFGVDDMGSTPAGRLSNVTFGQGTSTQQFATGGEGVHQLSYGEMPQHHHSGRTYDDGVDHQHYYYDFGGPPGSGGTLGSGTANTGDHQRQTDGANQYMHGHNFDTSYEGSNFGHNNMPPFALGTWLIRL